MALAAGALQLERLHATFEALCRIPSPTGHERAVADWVLTELGALGYELQEDDAGGAVGSDAGNLLLPRVGHVLRAPGYGSPHRSGGA